VPPTPQVPDSVAQSSQLHSSELTGAQSALVRALLEKNESVAMMYVGAIRARAATNNPDHLSQACHSIRELIDNLPKYFEVPVEPSGRLGDRVNALADRWQKEKRVKNNSEEVISEGFAKQLEKFFIWKQENFIKRREVARITVRDLDVSRRRLPGAIEDLRALEWMKIRDFFVASTHHGTCTADDFDAWVEVFERFMLDLTRPRTFETAAALDDLIRGVESDG
jgi:hypothetical protein